MLDSYEAGVRAMLALPPDDARNWYRIAMVHIMDCPHENWWFLPWHRGYLGSVERVIRELSGNPRFALPFWDWTDAPSVPARFFQGLLDPTNAGYIENYSIFADRMRDPIGRMWSALTPEQAKELRTRGITSADVLLAGMRSAFAPRAGARGIKADAPGLDDVTREMVSAKKLEAALRPTGFADFGSVAGTSHHARPGARALETESHGNVHYNVGGMMGRFLSPVDPLFFLHHSNLDRLWTLWTARQRQAGRDPLPTGGEGARWGKEPFLFFSDVTGKQIVATAGDFAETSAFDYEYGPGWAPRAGPVFAVRPMTTIKGVLQSTAMVLGQSASASATVAAGTINAAANDDGERNVSAEVTIDRPVEGSENVRFLVFVNPPESEPVLSASDPSFAGSIRFFDDAHHGSGRSTFTVTLGPALQALREAGTLRTTEPLRIEVVPDTDGAARRVMRTRLRGVDVRVF